MLPSKSDQEQVALSNPSLQNLINEILHVPSDDATPRLSVATIEDRYRSKYERDFSNFLALFDVESTRLEAQALFCQDCLNAVDHLRSRVQSITGESPRPQLVHVLLRPHIVRYITPILPDCPPGNAIRKCASIDTSRWTSLGNKLVHLMTGEFLDSTQLFAHMRRGFKAILVRNVNSEENFGSLWLANDFGVVPDIGDLPSTHLKEALLRLFWYLEQFHGETVASRAYLQFLNPLDKFPLQYLASVFENDAITLLQEYTQGLRNVRPNYEIYQVGGHSHDPTFRAEITNLGDFNCVAHAASKSEARKAAAMASLDRIQSARHSRASLILLLQKKIARQRANTSPGSQLRVPARARIVLEKARSELRLNVSVEEFAIALTTAGDVSRIPALGYESSNERYAFCGSWLLELLCEEAGFISPHRTHPESLSIVASELGRLRMILWPRGDSVGREGLLDSVQAILFMEYKFGGLQHVRRMFKQMFSDVSDSAAPDGEYREGIAYTTYLQEVTQAFGGARPEYQYELMTPPHLSHAPRYRCVASYRGLRGVGEGGRKRLARNRAAFELLRLLEHA